MLRLPGFAELLIILALVVFIFGAKRFSQIGTALGRVTSEFHKGQSGDAEEASTNKEPAESIDLNLVGGIYRNVSLLRRPRQLLLRLAHWFLFRSR